MSVGFYGGEVQLLQLDCNMYYNVNWKKSRSSLPDKKVR